MHDIEWCWILLFGGIKLKMEQTTTIEKELRYIIERIKWIRETRAIVAKEETELSAPQLADLDKVNDVYRYFVELYKGKKVMMQKKQLIFIMLYFFSPSALGGAKMRRGLRERIANVLGCTCSNVSHDFKNISFYYKTYRNFRLNVNEAIYEIRKELEKRGEA